MITELVAVGGAIGGFSVEIGPRLPTNVNDSILRNAERWPATFLAVTPKVATDSITKAELVDRAIYVGVNQKVGSSFENVVSLSGASLLPWFGDGDGVGPQPDLDLVGDELLEDAFGSWGNLNGLTPVMAGDDPGSPDPPVWTWVPQFGSVRRQVNIKADSLTDTGVEMLAVGPELRFGVTLGVTEPTVVCTPGAQDDPGGFNGLDCATAVDFDGTNYITEARMRVGTGSTEYVEYQDDLPKDWGGVNNLQLALCQPEGGDAADEAAARNQGKVKLAECTVQKSFQVQARMRPDLREVITPGDYVWVYDPDKLVTSNAYTVSFMGRTISPVLVRVFGVEWPVTRDFSVWWIGNGADPVIYKLDDYMRWQSGAVTLQVGAPIRPTFARQSPRQFRSLGT